MPVECRDCLYWLDAQKRAVADHRTSADYLRIMAGRTVDAKEAMWLRVAADELDMLTFNMTALDMENAFLRGLLEKKMRLEASA